MRPTCERPAAWQHMPTNDPLSTRKGSVQAEKNALRRRCSETSQLGKDAMSDN